VPLARHVARRLVATALLGLASIAVSPSVNYVTAFPIVEMPISEGNRWLNGRAYGADWNDVSTTPGLAFGTQPGTGRFDDSVAVLRGSWGPDQSLTAIVHAVTPKGGGVYEEVELLLRWSLSPHSAKGYEINFRALNSSESYAEIVRWNGPKGNFTYLVQRRGLAYGIKDGDIVAATVEGILITSYINGVAVAWARDSTYAAGSPGIGFYLQGASGVNRDYGFTSFSASATGTLPLASPAGGCPRLSVRGWSSP